MSWWTYLWNLLTGKSGPSYEEIANADPSIAPEEKAPAKASDPSAPPPPPEPAPTPDPSAPPPEPDSPVDTRSMFSQSTRTGTPVPRRTLLGRPRRHTTPPFDTSEVEPPATDEVPRTLAPVSPEDAWGAAVSAWYAGLEPHTQAMWRAVLDHTTDATAPEPGQDWLQHMYGLTKAVDGFGDVVIDWLRTPTASEASANTIVLRGLIWGLRDHRVDNRATVLGVFAERSIARSTESGDAFRTLANAAVWTLGELPQAEGMAALEALSEVVRGERPPAEMPAASAPAPQEPPPEEDAPRAEKPAPEDPPTTAPPNPWLPAEDTAEIPPPDTGSEVEANIPPQPDIPDHGLDQDGVRTTEIGGCKAELSLTGGQADLRFDNGKGKWLKGVPKAARDADDDAVKALKAEVKALQSEVEAEVARIERFYLEQRAIPAKHLVSHYLKHPVVGHVACGLFWAHGKDIVVCNGQNLETLDGRVVPGGAVLTLWHPCGASTDTLAAMKSWSLDHDTHQAFPQIERQVFKVDENPCMRFADSQTDARKIDRIGPEMGFEVQPLTANIGPTLDAGGLKATLRYRDVVARGGKARVVWGGIEIRDANGLVKPEDLDAMLVSELLLRFQRLHDACA